MLIIDVQNDFCAGGALAVPGAGAVVDPINRLTDACSQASVPVFATRDWHPAVTAHFTPYGGIWPIHCVAETDGAAFHPDLRLPADVCVVSKGEKADAYGYSAFDGRPRPGGRLTDALVAKGVDHLYVGGLATDYCVRASVLDARCAGFRVSLMTDAVAGVNVHPGDAEHAITEMRVAGAELTTSGAILQTLRAAKSRLTAQPQQRGR